VKFIDASEQALVLGVYRITTDGSRGESFVFQLVTASDERIAHIQDYPRARRRRSTPRSLPDGAHSQNLAPRVRPVRALNGSSRPDEDGRSWNP